MVVLGRRSNVDLIINPIVFVICFAIAMYFGKITFDYYIARFTNDMEALEIFYPIYLEYCFDVWLLRRYYVTPLDYTLVSFFWSCMSFISFNKRVVQPRILIECDNKGFYLNMPHNKTWYVYYNEIVAINVMPFETPQYIKKRNANMFFYDPDDYIEVTATPMTEGVQGSIKVHTHKETFQVNGVANALKVAREMQVICNDRKRKYNETLEKKAQERREYELREKTKT